MNKTITLIIFWLAGPLFTFHFGQSFTRIIDSSNAVVSDSFPGGYPGAAWIDYNSDGLLDLFVNNDYLYKNEGNGNFSKNLTFKGNTQPITPPNTISSGSSWADYDNDGDLDMFSASSKSWLFRNEGDESFTRITKGIIADSVANRGWGCAWADYDNDGNIDLLIVHPANFVPGTPLPNLLFHNDGPPDYTFTKITDFHFTTQLAPYTVATWSDYDLDGDVDLFIGSGPATGTPARDYLYKNMLIENGSVSFERINDSPLGTDLQDGQVWNWIDFDNDGDLDAFLTNYGAAPNRFYRNDNGTFISVTTGMELGSMACLANSWGDFDNDGYLDVVITSETKNYFFHNNGDGTFSSVTNAVSINGNGRGVTIGDYDNDGDLDIFIIGNPAGRGLFRNDNQNGNNWIFLKLTGTQSNKAAIGARIRLKANINGNSIWQMREVAAQNGFNSQNSLDVHFGLGNASKIDSIIIYWPSGIQQILTNEDLNNSLEIIETGSADINYNEINNLNNFKLEQNYPNPFNPATKIKYFVPHNSYVTLKVYNLIGELKKILVQDYKNIGEHLIEFNANGLNSGIYFYVLSAGEFISSNKMILLK